jgi:hypothetical protein
MTALAPEQYCDHAVNFPQARPLALAGMDDKIGAPHLFPVRHLARPNGRQALPGHTGPAQYPLGLDEGRRHHHGHGVAAALTAGLKQQWYIAYRKRAVARRRETQKTPLHGADSGVDDGLKTVGGVIVAEYSLAKDSAINPAIRSGAGKRRLDSGYRRAAGANQLVNRGVGVEYGRTQILQHRGGSAFTHADGAGKAENNHGSDPST